MDTTGLKIRHEPFFETEHVRFYFMRKPVVWTEQMEPQPAPMAVFRDWAPIPPESERPEKVEEYPRTEKFFDSAGNTPNTSKMSPVWTIQPGSFNPSCLIVAERNETSPSAKGYMIYEKELERWSASFSQTYIFDEEFPRQAVFEDPSGRKIVVRVRSKVKTARDGGSADLEALRSMNSENRDPPEKPTVLLDVPDTLSKDNENFVTNEWDWDLDSIWWKENKSKQTGKTGSEESNKETQRPQGSLLACDAADGLDVDEPGPNWYQDLSPFGLPQYRIVSCSGRERFRTWMWLYRRELTADEVQQVYNIDMKEVPKDRLTEMPACVVPVAWVDWEVDYACSFKFTPGKEHLGAECIPHRANYGLRLARPSSVHHRQGINWMEMNLCERCVEHMAPPVGDVEDHWRYFPDLRLKVDIADHMIYYANVVGDGDDPAGSQAAGDLTHYKDADDPKAEGAEFELNILLKAAEQQTPGDKALPADATILYPKWRTDEHKKLLKKLSIRRSFIQEGTKSRRADGRNKGVEEREKEPL